MSPQKNIGMYIMEYLEKKKADVTFMELYVALKQFSEQGIRNSMYSLLRRGAVKRLKVPGEKTIRFKIKRAR